MNHRHLSIVLLLVAGLATAPRTLGQAADKKIKVERIYENYCAQCHGKEFEGGLGGSLVDGIWKHGGSDEEITRSIAKGNEALGMQPWEGVLSAEQIRSLVIFLREKEKLEKFRKLDLPKPSPDKVTKTNHHSYRIEMVAEGLDIPWGIAFLPDGRKLVTERPGPVRVIDKDGKLLPPIEDIPAVIHHGQGGMMEVAVHPDYEKNGWIYLGFSDGWRDEKNKPRTLTAVVRGRLKENRWVDQEWIWKGDPKFYTGAGVHFGTRIVFDKGYLYFPVGERGGMKEAQDPANPKGKIFRLHDDGRIPEDNPFAGSDWANPGVWSYGHRNPQGLVLDPNDGSLWSTEHGPRGGDELNLIRKGANYGWPVVTFGMNYDGTPMTSETAREGIEPPVLHWTPSIAACGLAIGNGKAFPKWNRDLFAGALAQQEIRRLRISGGKVIEEEIIFKGIGRVRDVKTAPDGTLYVVLNDPHRIVRLVPADN